MDREAWWTTDHRIAESDDWARTYIYIPTYLYTRTQIYIYTYKHINMEVVLITVYIHI